MYIFVWLNTHIEGHHCHKTGALPRGRPRSTYLSSISDVLKEARIRSDKKIKSCMKRLVVVVVRLESCVIELSWSLPAPPAGQRRELYVMLNDIHTRICYIYCSVDY